MEKANDIILEKKEKRPGINKVLIVIIVILLLIVAIGFGYFLGISNSNESDKDTSKEELEKVTEVEESEETELDKLTKESEVVKELFEVFREDKNCHIYELWTSKTENAAKRYLAYTAIDETDFNQVKCGDLDDSFIDGLYCAMNDESAKYYGNGDEIGYETAIKDETTRSFKESVLEDKYKELFGQDAQVEKGDFSIGYGPIAHYDEANKLYAEFKCECGGMCVPSVHTLDSVTQNGKTLILYTTLTSEDDLVNEGISYTFEYEEESGNYIFVSRSRM